MRKCKKYWPCTTVTTCTKNADIMTTNRKFEYAAALRSRIALLVALVVHIALIGFLVLKSEDVPSIFSKMISPTKKVENRP
jgi:hypothetical protein